MRFRIKNKARSMFIGTNLNDNQWHDVILMKGRGECIVILDGDQISGSIPDGPSSFTESADLFIGGVPIDMAVTSLSNPQIKFVLPRFVGHVRNLKYLVSERPRRWYRPELLKSSGISEDPSDLCGSNDWCQNNGLCISSDPSVHRCDCTNTGYIGLTCNELKQSTSATFEGSEYISYSLHKRKISSTRDETMFEFRTIRPTGLILSVGEHSDFIYAAMNHGKVEVAVNVGSGEFRELISSLKPNGFIDNTWHKVRITRENWEVTVRVDESIRAQGRSEGDFMLLTASREFLVGGAPDPRTAPGYREVEENFHGNLRDVIYNGEDFMLELLDLACDRDPFVQISGNVIFAIEDVDAIDPITFLTEDSYLLLPKWNAKTEGTLSFSFRTNEPSGVIMYNRGADHITDFFALELMDGYLYMVLDLGSGSIRYKAPTPPLNDGLWHYVFIDRHHTRGTVQVDNQEVGKFAVGGTSRHLNLQDHLVVGGIDFETDGAFLPIDLFSGVLRKGYVGCLKNLVLQGDTIDLPEFAVEQDNSDVRPFCREEEPQCASEPCQHGGLCMEGWNRFVCDCRITGYTGKTCEEEVARLSFNGNQYMRITVPTNSRSKVEDIFLRFRTRFPDGLLVATSSDSVIDVLMVELSQGEIRVLTNYGMGQTTITAGHSLDDNKWHAVHVQRQDDHLMVTVDNVDRAEVRENFQSGVLDYHYIEVGGLTNRDSMSNPPINFVGHMEQFLYNNQPYFDMARARPLDNVRLNATFGERMSQREVINPFTFRTKEVFCQLETPDSYPALSLFFHFKTTEPNGLLLYSEGDDTDFVSVGLVGGQIQYAFNMGAGSVKMHVTTAHKLNDNKWHEVSISRDSRERHVLQVDDSTSIAGPSAIARHLDLTENLYVGGVESENYDLLPEGVEARVGYQGCFASLEINGRRKDLFDTAISIEDKEDLVKGCEDNGDMCRTDVCANGGQCIPGWNGYSCDCRTTSFTGTNCSEVSTSFMFGSGGGLISLQLPESQWLRTDHDDLSLGVSTRSATAIIARIDSATSDDYIEMELVNGYLWIVYNFGSGDHTISDGRNRINDGVYHVIHFSRTGANATLQVDQYAQITKIPRGKQSTFFDDQAVVSLGGRSGSARRRRRRRSVPSPPFEGMMSGLSYNDMRILDIAASDDARIQMDGNVIRVEDPASIIYSTPLPTTGGGGGGAVSTTTTRRTPVLPPVREPESTPNTDHTSPTKVYPMI
ncbi:neurexin-3-like [Diadema antillarum]|uniref:neurexin-3-like n=1 Tax=Diadema antillarum TaxID=105358 RepID=UPI003A8B9C5B